MSNNHRGRIVFHHPGPVERGGSSGSQVRPRYLLSAFQEAGYVVEEVVGYGAERKDQIKRLFAGNNSTRELDFVYSESRSIPTLLTEKSRLPTYPVMDFWFLSALKSAGVPVGLFYRDVFWRFGMYLDMLPWYARAITVPLYRYDWWWYQRSVDHLFLPSMGMAEHLPGKWPESRMSALPPGTAVYPLRERERSLRDSDLRLLYVGGVTPPAYDLEPLFKLLLGQSGLRLTLCCRQKEWQNVRAYYREMVNKGKVEIVHKTGDEVSGLYQNADLFVVIRRPHEYLDFAVPVKIFEALGHGVPVVTLRGTEAARIVEQEKLGWVVSGKEELSELMQWLRGSPNELEKMRHGLIQARLRHSWRSRVDEIGERLKR